MSLIEALNEAKQLHEAGRLPDALHAYDAVLAFCRSVVRRDPTVPRAPLAEVLSDRARVLHDMEKAEEALGAYDEAIVEYRELARCEPAEYGSALAGVLGNSAVLLSETGRDCEAAARIEDALGMPGIDKERGLVPFLLGVAGRVYVETDPGKAWAAQGRLTSLDDTQYLGKHCWLTDTPTPHNIYAIHELAEAQERELRDLLRAPALVPVLPERDGVAAQGLLCLLRGWASYSTIPLLRWDDETAGSNGGGFLLWWNGWGAVVDPGLGFCRAFRKAGFFVRNIDSVVCTHHHIDHTGDVPSLLTCFHETNSDDYTPHPVGFYMSPGAYLAHEATAQRVRKVEPVVELRPDQPVPIECRGRLVATLIPVTAVHKDLTGSDDAAVGCVFDLHGADGETLCRVGFTGDTRLPSPVPGALADVDVLVINLGSVYEKDVRDGVPQQDLPWHLGVGDTAKYVTELRRLSSPNWDPLVVVSEWGEELQGYRRYICNDIARRTELPQERVLPVAEEGCVGLWARRAELVCSKHAERVATTWVEQADGSVRYCCEECSPADRQPRT